MSMQRWWLGLGVLLGLAGFAVGLRAWRKWAKHRRFARGRAAEPRAAALATKRGYRVIATQVPGTVDMRVDGVRHQAKVRADLLLSRGGRRYVGEVKTGRYAPDPTGRDTRRQLLEYTTAFRVDGLLLFDMEAERIREVRFSSQPASRGRWPAVLGLVIFGLLVEATLAPLTVLGRIFTKAM